MTCNGTVGSAEKYRYGGTKSACTNNYIRFTIPVYKGFLFLQQCLILPCRYFLLSLSACSQVLALHSIL